MKTCSMQCGILLCMCISILLALTILYSSNDTHALLEMVHNELSQSTNNLESKFRQDADNNAVLIFKDEFTFSFPDADMTSVHNQNSHVRVKRDGILHADNIQANRIKTNKIFAKHVTADVVKADKVKAIVISIGKAFSIHKANMPTDAPETLVLERDGPDPTDASVTILLERDHKPISINGHPLYEKEKQRLLNVRKSFVRQKSSKPNKDYMFLRNSGSKKPVIRKISRNAMKDIQNSIPQKPPRKQYSKSENKIQSQTKNINPRPKNISENSVRESGKIKMNHLKKKKLLMAHWKNQLIAFQRQKVLKERRLAMQNRLPSTVQTPIKVKVNPNNHSNKLVVQRIQIPKQSVFPNTIQYKTLPRPIPNSIPWKPFPKVPYIRPLIKKADDSLHMDSDTDESPEKEFNSFENLIDVDNENEGSENLRLKTFERTIPSFAWDDESFDAEYSYESDKSGIFDYFESSDEKGTYGSFDEISDAINTEVKEHSNEDDDIRNRRKQVKTSNEKDNSSEYEYYSYEDSDDLESEESDGDSDLTDSTSSIESNDQTGRIKNLVKNSKIIVDYDSSSYEDEDDSLYQDRDGKNSTQKHESLKTYKKVKAKVIDIYTSRDFESTSHRTVQSSAKVQRGSIPKGNTNNRNIKVSANKVTSTRNLQQKDGFFSESAEEWFNERDNSELSDEFSTEEMKETSSKSMKL